MKICIVAPSLQMGGVERASSTIANYFARADEEVDFLCVFPHQFFFELHESVKTRKPEFNQKSLQMWKSIWWLRKEIKRIDPQVVLAFNNIYGALTILALLGTNYKICTSDRSSPLFKWPWKIHLFNKLVFYLSPPDGVISQTAIAAHYTKKRVRGTFKQIVIPNAVRHVQEFAVEREKIVLAVGRLGDYLKGFDRLIRAFALVKDKEWKLVFAGGNEDGGHLKKIASDLNIIDRLEFLGKVKDIDRIYAKSGIFVIPSRSEGFPNALCEAMAAGLPCISFDFIAGPADIISNEVNGILVENGNEMALAEQIQRLIESNDLRLKLGTNARQIRSRLNEDLIGRQYLDFLKALASNNEN